MVKHVCICKWFVKNVEVSFCCSSSMLGRLFIYQFTAWNITELIAKYDKLLLPNVNHAKTMSTKKVCVTGVLLNSSHDEMLYSWWSAVE